MSLQQYEINVEQATIEVNIGDTPVGAQVARAGSMGVPNGSDTCSVNFATVLAGLSTDYAVLLTVQNTLDSFPQDLTARVSGFTTATLTVKLNAPVDTANYTVNWMIVGKVNG